MDVVIRGGTVICPDGARRADVLVRGETVRAVGPDIAAPGAREMDASGMYVVPGGVDAHTHFDLIAGSEKTSDDWYTGTVAAACGGTTTVVDHPAFGPAGCSVFHQIDKYRALADGNAAVDYSLHGVLQHVDRTVLADLEGLVRRGITSAKLYLTYDFRLEDEDALRVLRRMRELGGLTAVHCENHGIVTWLRKRFAEEGKLQPWYHSLSRPPEAEAEAVGRMLRLSEALGRSGGGYPLLYVVHLSSAAGLEEIRRGRERGIPVFAETCPQYLILTEEKYHEPNLGGLKYVMSPPLRADADREALWQGLREGLIQTVGTDHCSFLFSRKKELGAGSFLSCPNGAPGVETRMPLFFSFGVMQKRITPERFVELTAEAPARLMGLYPRKGAIAEGSDADIVLMDPLARVRLSVGNLHQEADYTPFEGIEVSGHPVLTMLRGKVIWEKGKFLGSRGGGKFLARGLPSFRMP